MDTIKITVSFAPFESWMADLLMAEMVDLGFDTFQETETGFEAFIPESNFRREQLAKLITENTGCQMTWSEEVIPSQNWNEVWEKNYFQPLVIKDQVLVRAPFHTEFPDCPIEIVIEPNMAFGTGNHETTSLMMESMLELDFRNKSVLDMGCGTGILAILASKLGASEITAIDNDPWSFEAVSENKTINHAPNVIPLLGDGDSIPGDGVSDSVTSYDIILVNIQRNVIMADMGKYARVLKPGGHILFSGFFEQDHFIINEKAASLHLNFTGSKSRNKWMAAVYEKD